MGDIDVGDFNKSRGILIAWSCLVLTLWFFEADLTSFKLLGNEISLKRNHEHVWLLMAFINLYLLMRYAQRLPKGFYKFSDQMDGLYNNLLCRYGLGVGRRNLKRQPKAYGEHVEYLESKAVMAYMEKSDAPSYLSRKDRTRTQILHHYKTKDSKGNIAQQWRVGAWVVPRKAEAYCMKAVAVLLGAFTVPWFTDLFAPLILGMASTLTAIFVWY